MDQTLILLVDDEVPFVGTMTRRLSKRGFEIVPALSGHQALGVLSGKPRVDVVILDGQDA
jgi:CheY-like chemotaxis protein